MVLLACVGGLTLLACACAFDGFLLLFLPVSTGLPLRLFVADSCSSLPRHTVPPSSWRAVAGANTAIREKYPSIVDGGQVFCGPSLRSELRSVLAPTRQDHKRHSRDRLGALGAKDHSRTRGTQSRAVETQS